MEMGTGRGRPGEPGQPGQPGDIGPGGIRGGMGGRGGRGGRGGQLNERRWILLSLSFAFVAMIISVGTLLTARDVQNLTHDLREASLAQCARGNDIRSQVDMNERLLYEAIVRGLVTVKPHLLKLANMLLAVPLVDCKNLVDHPTSYRPPRPTPIALSRPPGWYTP